MLLLLLLLLFLLCLHQIKGTSTDFLDTFCITGLLFRNQIKDLDTD
jgi:hypothetical protein